MEGKSLLVTGGNTGIGLAAALLFARLGVHVAIYARRAERNEAARAEIERCGVRCLTFSGDVADEKAIATAVERTMQEFGGLHYAFNNAGVEQTPLPITELSEAEYAEQTDVNVKGTFLGMKYEIPAIIASGGGAICNNASAAGLVGVAYQSLYAAAKFAVVGMTRSAALEQAKSGVRINAVCPGATTGDMNLRFSAKFPEAGAQAAALHPMGRIGAKEEVAQAVLFLCRDATFTTGHAFPVDGGLTTP